jgi:hypothetical protein
LFAELIYKLCVVKLSRINMGRDNCNDNEVEVKELVNAAGYISGSGGVSWSNAEI